MSAVQQTWPLPHSIAPTSGAQGNPGAAQVYPMLTHALLMYALFFVPLFFIGACLLTGLPIALSIQDYYNHRGRQSVTCPDSGQATDVEVDGKFAFWTALRGQQHSRLQSCSRWPEKGDCGQECLAQLDPSPENVDRLLSKWYEGKTCVDCARALSEADWRQSRLAGLDQNQKLVELREMTLDRFASELEHIRPLCWPCHQQERERQAVPATILKGDRHGLATMKNAV